MLSTTSRALSVWFRLGLLVAVLPGTALAQMLVPGGPATFEPFTVKATELPGAGGSPSMAELSARGAIPIASTDTDRWSAGVYAANVRLGGDLRLAPDQPPIPRDLWALDGNLAYTHRLEDGKVLGATAGVGALSDRPFHGIHETNFNATATYLLPRPGGNAWLLGLNFSSARPVLNYVPLPVVAYLWRAPEHGLDGAVGVPFARVRWRPAPVWELQLTAIVPTRLDAEIALSPVESIRVSAGFRWDQQFWALAGRSDTSSWLFYDSMRAEVGVEVPLLRPLALRASGGYAFDRSFFEGTSIFDRGDRADLAATWFAAVTLRIRPPAPPRT